MHEWTIYTLKVKFFWVVEAWIYKSILLLINQIQFLDTILYSLLFLSMLNDASDRKKNKKQKTKKPKKTHNAILHPQPCVNLCLQWQHGCCKILRTVTKIVYWWIFRKTSLLYPESSTVTGNCSKHKISCVCRYNLQLCVWVCLRYISIAPLFTFQ